MTEPVVAHVTPVAVVSPCINHCTIDPATALCEGCARTLAEIVDWSNGTPQWRADIMAQLPQRQNRATPD